MTYPRPLRHETCKGKFPALAPPPPLPAPGGNPRRFAWGLTCRPPLRRSYPLTLSRKLLLRPRTGRKSALRPGSFRASCAGNPALCAGSLRRRRFALRRIGCGGRWPPWRGRSSAPRQTSPRPQLHRQAMPALQAAFRPRTRRGGALLTGLPAGRTPLSTPRARWAGAVAALTRRQSAGAFSRPPCRARPAAPPECVESDGRSGRCFATASAPAPSPPLPAAPQCWPPTLRAASRGGSAAHNSLAQLRQGAQMLARHTDRIPQRRAETCRARVGR